MFNEFIDLKYVYFTVYTTHSFMLLLSYHLSCANTFTSSSISNSFYIIGPNYIIVNKNGILGVGYVRDHKK